MKDSLQLFLCCVVLVLTTSGQVPLKPESDETIKVKTSLVLVPVTVKSREGMTVTGLTKDKFTIFEDGVEQEVALFETPDKPILVALVLDQSDSTKISLDDIRSAALSFVDRLQPQDRAIIVAFDSKINRLTQATNDRDMLSYAVSILKTGGGTSLYEALEVTTVSYLGPEGSRKALVVLTDGIDTSSKVSTFESSAAAVAAANVAVYPVQYPSEDFLSKRLSSENSQMGAPIYTTPSGESISSAHQRGTRYLKQIVASSGGRFHFAESPAKLKQAFDRILAELRQQYYVGYYPIKQGEKIEKRRIKVVVDRPDARVDSRETFLYKP